MQDHRKLLKELQRFAKSQGWSVSISRTCHIKFTSPLGKVVTVSSTPRKNSPYTRKKILKNFSDAGLNINAFKK